MTRPFQLLALAVLTLLFTLPAQAKDLPATTQANGEPLSLNGKGTRKKLFIKLYNAGLYLKTPSQDAKAIVDADEAMSIKLNIISDLITAEKMENATMEGFNKSTGGNLSPLAGEIDQFMGVFKQGIENGDSYDFTYAPGTGTVVSKNGTAQVTIGGLPFKQALFGIWLGEQPAQEKLKKGMLGK